MLTDILYAVLRTFAAFVMLLIITRLLGRKMISQMTFFDFAVGITFGSVTAIIGLGSEQKFHTSLTVLITLGLLGYFTDYLHIKSFLLSKLLNSEPLVLIKDNQIIDKNMKKARLTLMELNSLLRDKNAFSINDVNYAVLENDGKLSVMLKGDKNPVTPADLMMHPADKALTRELIIDGRLQYENLTASSVTEAWLSDELNKRGIIDIADVFFAALDSSGGLYVSKRQKRAEKEGEHGIE
jgi:uncharacterized membrane protein YcaP (DUF421 family)